MLIFLLLKFLNKSLTLFESAPEELLFKELSSVWIFDCSDISWGCALGLPEYLSQNLMSSYVVLMEGVVLTAHNFYLIGACVPISQQKYEALSLQRSKIHLSHMNPNLGNAITIIEVIFGATVTCSVLFVECLNVEWVVEVLELFPDLFLASQLIIEGILLCWLLPIGNAVVRDVMNLGCRVKVYVRKINKAYLFCKDQTISRLAK